MKYYNIKIDDTGKLYFELEDTPIETDYMIYDTVSNKLFSNQFNTVMTTDSDPTVVTIGMAEFNIDHIVPITNQEAADIYSNISMTKPMVVKNTKSKIMSPAVAKYPPFTRVVVNAILKYGQDISISPSDHSRKVSLIASINKIAAEGDKEISISKAEEILKLFTLDLKYLFREELL